MEIIFNERSLAQMTIEQHKALLTMVERNKSLVKIQVMTGGFDLPQGFLTFTQEFGLTGNIYGGISPKGEVST